MPAPNLFIYDVVGPPAAALVLLATGVPADALNFDDLMAAGTWNGFGRAWTAAAAQLGIDLADTIGGAR